MSESALFGTASGTIKGNTFGDVEYPSWMVMRGIQWNILTQARRALLPACPSLIGVVLLWIRENVFHVQPCYRLLGPGNLFPNSCNYTCGTRTDLSEGLIWDFSRAIIVCAPIPQGSLFSRVMSGTRTNGSGNPYGNSQESLRFGMELGIEGEILQAAGLDHPSLPPHPHTVTLPQRLRRHWVLYQAWPSGLLPRNIDQGRRPCCFT